MTIAGENKANLFNIVEEISSSGFVCIDKRDSGGCLWVIDEDGTESMLKQLGVLHRFHFAEHGGRVTAYESAWWTKDKEFTRERQESLTISDSSTSDELKEICLSGRPTTDTAKAPDQESELLLGAPADNDFYTVDMMLAELSSLIDYPSIPESVEELDLPTITLTPEQARLRLFDDLGLPARWANKFELAGIYSVGDLAGKTFEEIENLQGIGSTAIDLLDDQLQARDLPNLTAFRRVEKPDCALPAKEEFQRLTPLGVEISVSPFSGAQPLLRTSAAQRWFFDLFPQANEEEIVAFSDCATVSYYRDLFLSIPEPHRTLYGENEYLFTFLSESVDHWITDFGFTDAVAFCTALADVLDAETSFENTSNAFIGLARESVPKVLQPVPIVWFRPDLESEVGRATVGDFLQNDSSPMYSHIAMSVADSIKDELNDYRSPISLENLLRRSLIDCGEKFEEREFDVFLKRNGIGIGPMTLEEIAGQYDVTRERIRQIEAKVFKRYNPACSRRLLPMRLAILGCAIELGYIGSIDEIDETLRHLGILSEEDSCAGFAALFPEIELTKSTASFRVIEYPCPSCSNAHERLREVAESNEPVTREAFLHLVGCEHCDFGLSPNLLHFELPQDVAVTDEFVFPKSHPRSRLARRPESVRARVADILASSGVAMSYDDVRDAYLEKYGVDVPKSRVMSHMGSDNDVVLWGRGTYIYKDFVSFPAQLIREIADMCKALFKENRVPILGVGGIFDMYRNRLQQAGVPTEHALYSLIRMINDKTLTLQEYPWVCDSRTIGTRTSFAKYFYSVLESNNGFITDDHAKQISERCLAQSFALGGLAEYSDYVINANGGWYDVEAADFDMKGIADIAIEVASTMGDNDIISTVKVFEDYRERCIRCGVKSHDILYCLIDMMEDNLPIEATRRPHLVKSEQKGLSVLSAMRLYIQSSEKPVSKGELYEEFVTKRRLKLRSICGSILVDEDVVQVGPDVYWSKKKMHIDDSFVSKIDEVLSSKVRYAKKNAGLFYARRDVLPDYRGLPSPGALAWNTILLKNVVDKSSHFRLFGDDCSCLVYLDENPSVTSAEAFYYELLDKEFMGWSSFDGFSDYCKAYSIADDLKPEFFDAYSSISADEISIQTQ